MIRLFNRSKLSPVGIDLGSRAVKLIQLDASRSKIIDAVRWELPHEPSSGDELELETTPAGTLMSDKRTDALVHALEQARVGRQLKGRDAVVSISAPELFLQNVRVPKGAPEDFHRHVFQEVAGRIPFPVQQAEVRYIDAADVRQGDSVRREVILLAVHQPVLNQMLDVVARAGWRPIAVDTAPTALLRCYVKQFRRDDDRRQRSMFVHLGASHTAVVIAQGAYVLFMKYLDVGGMQMDEAVARSLAMSVEDASSLRRHNGDRRADLQDPEIARGIQDSVRPVFDRLATELARCIRYHSVTFRGQPLVRVVLGGGEATPQLVDALSARLDVKCELGDPLRSIENAAQHGRKSQWDVATGLALKEVE